MKLELKGGIKENQTLVAIALIVVIVLAVGYVVYTNLPAGPGGEGTVVAPPMPGPAGTAPTAGPTGAPGTPQANPSAPPAPPGPAVAPAQPPAAPGPATAPAQPAPAAQSAPPAPTPPSPAVPSRPAPQKAGSRTVTVFGSVMVTYPNGWGIGTGSSASTAMFTNGKGVFELRAPDPKATDAKSIANAAVSRYAKGASVTSQGQEKIGGYDAYFCVVKGPMGITRIVGVDAPTRVVLVEYAKGGQFSAHKAAFDGMESQLSFK